MNRAPGKKPRNVGASVRDRLTQRARANADSVQLLLIRYAIERLLYRLSVSRHRDRLHFEGSHALQPVEPDALPRDRRS
jgi:hypothetical protein